MWASRKVPVLRSFWLYYTLFLAYGVAQVVRGIILGNPPLLALRDLSFNYYPLYFLLGLWAGLVRPDLLPKLLRGFAWFNGIYGLLFVLVLSRIDLIFPGVGDDIAPVPIFGQPIYSFVALLGLLAYEKNLARTWYLILLNAFVMLGMQIRTEWLALAVGTLVWAILQRHTKRLLQSFALMLGLFAVMYATDFSIPSPEGRSDSAFSARTVVNRAITPFRSDLTDSAAAAGSNTVEHEEATFVWRTVWWVAIWNSVHSDPRTATWGHGYGFALGDLVPYLSGTFIRTPHNELLYALGYTGWVGVALFFAFEIAILRLLWRSWKRSREPFGLAFWFAMMTYGLFFPLGETPYGAIPFYLIAGWMSAPAIWLLGSPAVATRPRLRPVGLSSADPGALASS